MPEKDVGYYEKYDVSRKDGKEDPDAVYFVLNISKDPKAMEAALYYAELLENETLYSDLEYMEMEFYK